MVEVMDRLHPSLDQSQPRALRSMTQTSRICQLVTCGRSGPSPSRQLVWHHHLVLRRAIPTSAPPKSTLFFFRPLQTNPMNSSQLEIASYLRFILYLSQQPRRDSLTQRHQGRRTGDL